MKMKDTHYEHYKLVLVHIDNVIGYTDTAGLNLGESNHIRADVDTRYLTELQVDRLLQELGIGRDAYSLNMASSWHLNNAAGLG